MFVIISCYTLVEKQLNMRNIYYFIAQYFQQRSTSCTYNVGLQIFYLTTQRPIIVEIYITYCQLSIGIFM